MLLVSVVRGKKCNETTVLPLCLCQLISVQSDLEPHLCLEYMVLGSVAHANANMHWGLYQNLSWDKLMSVDFGTNPHSPRGLTSLKIPRFSAGFMCLHAQFNGYLVSSKCLIFASIAFSESSFRWHLGCL